MKIPTRVIDSIGLSDIDGRGVARSFRALLDAGATLVAGGKALERPGSLVRGSRVPRFEIDAAPFGMRIFLTTVHQNPDLRFLVGYVVPGGNGRRRIYARIFYKDTSLIWRAASHIVSAGGEFWIGKGDVHDVEIDGELYECSRESTTDLPLELQHAVETAARAAESTPAGDRVLERVLRRAPAGRVVPYADFTGPRRRAAADPANRLNRGRPIATFARRHDPGSLRFARGFEPDLSRGVLPPEAGASHYYGGEVSFYRVLSTNRRVQYGFMAAPRQVWLIPPQALTLELSTFCVRTVDVDLDEDLCVPGYEFHFMEESGEGVVLHSQIPPGFAGPQHPDDEDRADASAWIERLPIVRAFRRQVLGERRG